MTGKYTGRVTRGPCTTTARASASAPPSTVARREGEQGGHPRGRARHAVPAGDEGAAEGDAAGRRQAGDPVRGRGGRRAPGITDILIVTGRGKRAIEDHFDRSFELEYFLEAKGKFDELKQVRADRRAWPTIHYIRQRDPLGLGHAVAVAEEHVGGEPFAVMLGDDIIARATPLLRRDARRARALRPQRDRASMEVAARGDLAVRLHRARAGRGGPRAGRRDRREAAARRGALEPRRDRPLRVHARRSSTRCARRSRGAAARSSSRTRSTCWPRSRPSTRKSSTAAGSTSATSSTT